MLRAFALATGERYASVLINLVATIVLARLLTPAEFGIVVIGLSASALVGALSELGAPSYIVQAPTLDREAVRTVFTINAALTLALAVALYLAAGPLARFYDLPPLADFLRVFALGMGFGPIWAPASALLARDLSFGRKSAASVAVTLANSLLSVVLAMRGLSHMSFAWAFVASNALAAVLYPIVARDASPYGLSLSRWRAVSSFGLFSGATRLLSVLGENAIFLIMGRFVAPGGIGLLYRAGMLLTFPDRILLGAASAVALPAFSATVRTNRAEVGETYVQAVELLSAVHWPAIALIGLLAHPLILLFLGPQWIEAATYVQIMACAALFNAPMSLNYPIQVATGAIRSTTILALFQGLTALACVLVAAPHGAEAIAWSVWISTPVNVMASVWLVRRVAPFSLARLGAGLWRSALATLAAAAPPLAIVALHGGFDLGLPASAAAVGLAGLAWAAALWLTRHPLLAKGLEFAQRLRAPAT